MRKAVIIVMALAVFASCADAQVLKRQSSGVQKPAKKLLVYSEGKETAFAPSGWMGDTGAIKVDANCAVKPHSGKYCMKWTYDISKSTKNGWAGVYWQYPANNWGSKPGLDLTGHKKLVFWLRGETGKEVINITAGGMKGENADSFTKELKSLRLSSEWRQYSVDITGRDLHNVVGGFCWTADSKENSGTVTFYIDDISYD